MKQLFYFLIVATLFTSCSKFADGQSVWAEGLWLLPVLIAIGFGLAVYRAWVAWNSGTVIGGGYPHGPKRDVTGPNGEKIRPPMYKNGWLWFAVILFVAFWVVVYVVNREA